MKIKHIALVALTALALGLAGAEGSEVAGAKPGLLSGSNSAEVAAPSIAGSKPGVVSGSNTAEIVVAEPGVIAGGIAGGVLHNGG